MISSDILSIALVGTAQRDRVTIDIGTAIDRLISELSDTEPERALLLGVGAWVIYWQAGRVTEHLAGMPEPAQAEQLAVCSPAVSRLLHRLFLREQCDVLPEALQRLQEAGFRLPYELLPLALDIQVRPVRAAVYPVLGERGMWLSRFNPAWAWVKNYLPAGEDALPQDAEIIWQEGTLAQRCEILRRARAIDPAKARAWLEAAWRQEKAETRLELLGTLEIGLSADDEPFLERALDDRAPSVRAAVPALLSRVPTSAFAHRMLQRADGILTGTQGKLKIKLPTAFDKAWQRDGIAEKPPSRVGERAWWLIQVLTYVPLSHWEEQFQLTPAELIEAAGADKSGNSLLEAWSRATEFFSAESWSGPLWDWWQQQQQKKRSASTTTADMREELLSCMTPHEAEHKVQRMMLASSLPGNEDWDDLLGVLPVPWSEQFGRSYLNALRGYLAAFNPGDKRYHTYDDPWFNSLESAAIRLPVPCFAAFEDWTLPTEQWREQWHEFTETLRTRQRFMEELAKTDDRQRPPNWVLSPWAVRTYVLGGKLTNGFEVSPKYIGNARLIEIAVATLATDRALLLYGVPGTAKCVKYDTLVLDTRTGQRVTITEACRRRDIELVSLQSNYRLRQQAPTDYIDNGIRPCYRVTTHLGREIEVTINHPFLTIDGWQPLANLHSGDRIAVPRTLPIFGNAELSDAHVKILAHLIAEGCLSHEVPYYTNTSPDMREDFSEAVQEAFPEVQAHWYPDGKQCSVSGGRRGNSFRNPCTQWLRDLGIMGTKSGNKFVPDIVFSLPKHQVALFLNRLFSGDGFLHLRSTTQQITIDYVSKSKRLILDIQHLLLRFGINARVVLQQSGHYRLFIYGKESCGIFLQEIGLLGRKYVEEALAHLKTVSNKLSNPNLDTIPHQIWSHLEQAAIDTGYTSIAMLVRADRKALYNTSKKTSRATIIRGQSISRSRLSRLASLA